MSLPPPYYASVAALQAESRDAATMLRRTSESIVKIDKDFSDVGYLLAGQQGITVSPASVKEDWQKTQKLFHSIIWGARTAATQVEARNKDFTEVIIPVVGDPDEPKEGKIAELYAFLSKNSPTFLTSAQVAQQLQEIEAGLTKVQRQYGEDADKKIAGLRADIAKWEKEREKARTKKEEEPATQTSNAGSGFFSRWTGSSSHTTSNRHTTSSTPAPETVDYDDKIADAQATIDKINSQRNEIKAKIADIKHAWATIPDQIGNCLSAIWTHLTTDATHLKNRLEGSTRDPIPDLSVVTRVYTEINLALKYYATNVTKMGP